MPLPKPFESDEEFLGYCESHSRTLRALFSGEQVNYLYELAGERPPFEYTSPLLFMTISHHEPSSRELLDKARENYERSDGENVIRLDDHR